MPIYMRITQNGLPVITGDVTAKGHEKWIELTSAQLGVLRSADTSGGTSGQQEATGPVAKEIFITKMQDSASGQLILAITTSGKGEMKIQIDFVKPDKKGDSTYLTFTLQNAIISSYSMAPSRGGKPHEKLTLNFTKITSNWHETGADISQNMGWRPLHP
jgi:type VI secretion system secreted protein Hcp